MKIDLLKLLKKTFIKHIRLIENHKQILYIPEPENLYISKKQWHFHPVAEIFIQISGVSCMHTFNEDLLCAAGEIMIMPKGVAHYENIHPCKSPFKNIVIAFGRQTVSMHVAIDGDNDKPNIIQMEQFALDNVSEITHYLDNIVLWQRSGNISYNNAAGGLLLTVLNLLLNTIEQPSAHRRNESYKVNQCRRLVSEHLANSQLSVKWLARIINCAPDYLSNIFHNETGITLTAYINDKRIDFAKELLENSSLNIAEISQACGYQDPGYMTRQFKKRFSESPRDYRSKTHRPLK